MASEPMMMRAFAETAGARGRLLALYSESKRDPENSGHWSLPDGWRWRSPCDQDGWYLSGPDGDIWRRGGTGAITARADHPPGLPALIRARNLAAQRKRGTTESNDGE